MRRCYYPNDSGTRSTLRETVGNGLQVARTRVTECGQALNAGESATHRGVAWLTVSYGWCWLGRYSQTWSWITYAATLPVSIPTTLNQLRTGPTSSEGRRSADHARHTARKVIHARRQIPTSSRQGNGSVSCVVGKGAVSKRANMLLARRTRIVRCWLNANVGILTTTRTPTSTHAGDGIARRVEHLPSAECSVVANTVCPTSP